jgi:hypothetical protein
MASKFIPFAGWEERKQIADAYAHWLAKQDFDWWVTLNFNCAKTLAGVRSQFGHWLARLDREHIGRNWYRRPADERTFAFAVAEHPQTSIHLHALLRMPKPARALGRPYQSESMINHWRLTESAGSCCVEWLYNIEGVARYMCKELPFPGRVENCILMSTEFHNYR